MTLIKGFAFHMKTLCMWKDPKTMENRQHFGNVYFSLNIACVQNHSSGMNVEDVTKDDDTFTVLMPDLLH